MDLVPYGHCFMGYPELKSLTGLEMINIYGAYPELRLRAEVKTLI